VLLSFFEVTLLQAKVSLPRNRVTLRAGEVLHRINEVLLPFSPSKFVISKGFLPTSEHLHIPLQLKNQLQL